MYYDENQETIKPAREHTFENVLTDQDGEAIKNRETIGPLPNSGKVISAINFVSNHIYSKDMMK